MVSNDFVNVARHKNVEITCSIAANSCLQIFIIIIAVLITHFAYASMRFGFSAEVNFAQNIISPLWTHRHEKLLIKLLLIKTPRNKIKALLATSNTDVRVEAVRMGDFMTEHRKSWQLIRIHSSLKLRVQDFFTQL